MGNAVAGYLPRSTGPGSSVGSGGGGGNVDDILKRLGGVETQVSAIVGTIPHLATKADVADLRASVGAIEALIPQLATKADVAIIPQLATKADLASMETAIIKWIIATTLTTAGLAFAIAKFVH